MISRVAMGRGNVVSRRNLLVLWIDDERAVVDGSLRRLAASGIDVIWAPDGHAGLGECARATFDLIILDEQMPEFCGLEVLVQLRNRAIAAPVMMLTAHGTPEHWVEARQLHAVAYRQKPLTGADLVSTIHAVVGSVPRPQHAQSHFSIWLNDFEASLDSCPRDTLTQLVEFLLSEPLPLPVFIAAARLLKATVLLDANGAPASVHKYAMKLKETAENACANGHATCNVIDTLDAALSADHALRLHQFARLVHQHPSVVSRVLRRETGASFREWKWGRIMRAATEELAAGCEQVAQIAFKCGYNHAHQFHRDFRRMFGMSPNQFRTFVREHQRACHRQ